MVYCDNVSAMYFSRNPVQHQHTKHIEMNIHFVREKVARGEIRVLHVPSHYPIVNIFTKDLSLILFEDFWNSLNLRQPPASQHTTTSRSDCRSMLEYMSIYFYI